MAAPPKPPLLLASVLLVTLVAILYGRVAGYQFVFDDRVLVESPRLTQGLGRESVGWAFTHVHDANWLPLTWLSHMLSFDLFGLWPGGHHLVNVALHAANSVLLLLAIHAMTGHFWPATFVAASFAVHPLHVESVAWVAERKDVLSTFFWFLTMLAWAGWVRRPTIGRYLSVAVLFALGLLAKATLVTLPFVLLLLDVWPLGRWKPIGARRLMVEKLPLVILSLATSAATLLAQHAGGSMQTVDMVPLAARVENVLVTYVAYLADALWPASLACFYPHPAIDPTSARALPARAIGAGLLLLALGGTVARFAPGRPYLAVGWLWYLGTLVPMIGLVQVGLQARADRYTYVPLVGIAILAAWAVRDLVRQRPALRRAAAAAMVVVVAGWSVATWFQVGTWRDSETLYRHALRVTRNNHLAHFNLGNALLQQGRTEEAKAHFQRTIAIQPTAANAYANLGVILQREGNVPEAMRAFETALRLEPDKAGTHNNLGVALLAQGRLDEAAEQFGRAIAIQPDYAEAHNGLGNALLRRGRLGEAAAEFGTALRLRPDYAEPYNGLGVLYATQGDLQQAAAHFEQALRIDPGHRGARDGLARVRGPGGEPAR